MRQKIHTVTIEKVMSLELQPSRQEDTGVLIDWISVRVLLSCYAHIIIRLARSGEGYHYGLSYETVSGSGGGFAPSPRWNRFGSKQEALSDALRLLGTYRELRRYYRAIDQARTELNKYKHEQLTLF